MDSKVRQFFHGGIKVRKYYRTIAKGIKVLNESKGRIKGLTEGVL